MCVLLGVAEGVGARAGQNPLSHGEAARGGRQQRLAPGAGPGWDPGHDPAEIPAETPAKTPAATPAKTLAATQAETPAETRLSPGRLPGGVLALSVWAVCSQMF